MFLLPVHFQICPVTFRWVIRNKSNRKYHSKCSHIALLQLFSNRKFSPWIHGMLCAINLAAVNPHSYDTAHQIHPSFIDHHRHETFRCARDRMMELHWNDSTTTHGNSNSNNEKKSVWIDERHVTDFTACHCTKSRRHDGVDERKILLLQVLLLLL